LYNAAIKKEGFLRPGALNSQTVSHREKDGRSALGLLTVAIFLAAILSVWSSSKVVSLGYEISIESHRLQKVKEINAKLKSELAMLKSPGRLEPIAKELLHMAPPDNRQIVIIK
jgi:cell division protein FtsL